MAEPNESKLLSVAASISEGASVDWEQVQAPDSERESEVLRELRVLDQIASFHRSSPAPSLTDAPAGLADDRAQEPTYVGTRWAHLAINEKVGEGAFARVYKATDARLQSDVALKLVKLGRPHGSSAERTRVLQEGRMLARVRHPNVVTVYGADEVNGQVGLWMEFVKGRTLAELLRTRGQFSAHEAALIGQDICRALAAVHTAGLLHGDVKAHNVMREDGGRIVLMDFGTGSDLARADGQADRGVVDDFAGTPLYLPPEIFAGGRRTKATDLYSLGVLLYHLVTGTYPVEGRTRGDIERAHREHQFKHLRDARPDLPEEFVQIVERALAPDPRDRYQTAGSFEAGLARFLGAPPPPHPSVWFTPSRFTAAGATVAVLLTAGLGYWILTRGPGEDALTSVSRSAEGPTRAASAPAAPPVAAAADAYQIETAIYRREEDGRERRLRSGERVGPGSLLFAQVRASVPVYVYIVNEDERGKSYLLFPLTGQTVTNPVAPGKFHRLPGMRGPKEFFWQVDTRGGREHFVVFASPARLTNVEQTIAQLPVPEIGRPIDSLPLPEDALRVFRGVGGLASDSKPVSGSLTLQFPTPLTDGEETTRGLWVRQLTLENPLR